MNKKKKRKILLLKILFYSILLLVFIPVALAIRIGNIKPYEESRPMEPKSLFKTSAKLVAMNTSDGTVVRGWYVSSGKSERIFIIVHGFGQSHEEMIYRLDAVYPEIGSAFFLDLRNHGISDPARTTFGYFEAIDIIAAVQYFRSRYQSVIVWGTSMGAAAVVRAKHLGCNIDIMILEAMYGDLRNSIYQYTNKFYIPKYPFAVTGLYFYETLYSVNFNEMNMIRLLAEIKDVPVLLVYSSADEDVSSTDFMGLKNVLGQESMAHTFDSGNHVSIYESNQNEYNKLIASFIKRN